MSENPWLTQRITCANSGELVKRQSNAPVITAKESFSTHKLAVPQKRKRRAVNFPHRTGAKNNRNLLAIEGYIFYCKCSKRRERAGFGERWKVLLGPGRQQWKQKRWESARLFGSGASLNFIFSQSKVSPDSRSSSHYGNVRACDVYTELAYTMQ